MEVPGEVGLPGVVEVPGEVEVLGEVGLPGVVEQQCRSLSEEVLLGVGRCRKRG